MRNRRLNHLPKLVKFSDVLGVPNHCVMEQKRGALISPRPGMNGHLVGQWNTLMGTVKASYSRKQLTTTMCQWSVH